VDLRKLLADAQCIPSLKKMEDVPPPALPFNYTAVSVWPT